MSSPWVCVGPNDLFIMNRLWQKWWDVTFIKRVWKSVASVSLTFSLWLFLSSDVESHLARTRGPQSNSQQRTESCQQPCEWAWSGSCSSWALRQDCNFDCSLSETLSGHLDCNLLRDSVADDPHWPMPVILTHRDCEIISVCCHYMLFFKKWNSRLKAINKVNGCIHHSILNEPLTFMY